MMTAEERRSPENGIWMCQTHAKLIDNDVERYPTALVREWKRQREEHARAEVEGSSTSKGEREELTEEEHDLLLRANTTGEIVLLRSEQHGEWVAVGPLDYIDPNDRSAAARYRHALASLCQHGLARHEDGVLYVLTAEGFSLAKRLRPRLRLELPERINEPGHFGPPFTPAWNVRLRLTASRVHVDVVDVSVDEEGVGKWLVDELFREGERITLPMRVDGAAEFWVRTRSPRTYDSGPVQLGALTLRVRDHLQVPGDAHELACRAYTVH